MSERTERPWIVLRNDQDDCFDIVGEQPDGYTFICDTRGEDSEANAQLIAAAPDLLAACKEVREDMLFDAQNNNLDEERDLMFNNIEAAIAKAEEV
jgi:hypothetical protein